MKPKILITNDDGIYSNGINLLIKILKPLGDLCVVAPLQEKSGAGHSITMHHPLRVRFLKKNVVAVEGTPTDCVMFGIYYLLNHKRPALLVSGINKGANLGDDITYSGTVSAALEGTLLGVPSMAVSLCGEKIFNLSGISKFLRNLCRLIIKNNLPKNTFLNINIPCVKKIKGTMLTKQGKRIYKDTMIKKIDPRGNSYFWLDGEKPSWEKGKNTDFEAIGKNMISITPLKFDLTNYEVMDKLTCFSKIKI
ncbi:MAG: 5'/3'-nucleotidase SurE [Candidatus Firestonebacteria bacterium]